MASGIDATLVRVDELKGYHDVERHPEGRSISGLLLYRFDAPLFFANASFFRREVREHAAAAGSRSLGRGRGGADHRRRHDRGGHARGTPGRASRPRASRWPSRR